MHVCIQSRSASTATATTANAVNPKLARGARWTPPPTRAPTARKTTTRCAKQVSPVSGAHAFLVVAAAPATHPPRPVSDASDTTQQYYECKFPVDLTSNVGTSQAASIPEPVTLRSGQWQFFNAQVEMGTPMHHIQYSVGPASPHRGHACDWRALFRPQRLCLPAAHDRSWKSQIRAPTQRRLRFSWYVILGCDHSHGATGSGRD
eukprot:COSAG01_NODE_2100_length_8429_cov_29.066507_1_plen_205_part_00